MGESRIYISVEIDKPPSDEYGDYGLSRRNAHFENGWFTYGVLLYDGEDADEFFTHNVVWPRPRKKENDNGEGTQSIPQEISQTTKGTQ